MAKTEISINEWLQELERLTKGTEDGLTMRELSKATGHSHPWIMRKLAMAKEEGLLVVGRRKVETIDGRVSFAPAYTLLKKKK